MGLTNIFMCFTCFLINWILCYTYYHNNDTKTDLFAKMFVCFINVLEVFCIIDMFNSLSLVFPNFPTVLNFISLTLFYLVVMFMVIPWMMCIFIYFNGSIYKNLKIIIIAIVLFVIEVVLLGINCFSHFIFDVTIDGSFENGKYAALALAPFYILDLVILIYVTVKTLKEKNTIMRKRNFGVFLFTFIPVIYSLLQIYFADVSLDVVGFTLAVLIIYIYSVSKKKEDQVIVQKNLQKDTIVKCVNVLYDYSSTNVAIDKILNLLGRYHNSESSIICEFDFKTKEIIIINSWTKKRINSNNIQDMKLPISLIDKWISSFEKTDIFSIESVEKEIDKSSSLYSILSNNNINSIMAVPIRQNEQIVGFISIFNIEENKNDFTVMHAISSIIYTELSRRKHNQQDDELIKILASEYSSVFYSNLKDGIIIPYSINENAKKTYGAMLENGITFERFLKIFVEHDVYPTDIDKMKKYSDLEYIKNELKNKKKLSIVFRTNQNGSPVYHEVNFVKIDDTDKDPTAIAIGFKNKMDEVISQYVMNELLESYASVFYIDFPSNKIRAYKQSTTMEVGRFAEELPYDKVVHSFADAVDPEYKELWDKLADVNEAQKLLIDDNTREIIYEVKGLEQKKRRAYWKVLDRQDGIPVTAIIGFMGVDNVTAQEYDLNKQVAEQKKALENQSVLLENALREAQIANKEKTEFLSNMSHDIRTPMNAIIGFTELALQNLDDKEKIRDYILKSNVSSQHLLSLINDILEMKRIESGKFTLNENICSISELINDTETIIRSMADSKKQDLKLEKLDIRNEYVYCDKLRINQITINLLSNAIKFTPNGGIITASVVQKGLVDNIAEYEFRVKDNGIGMSKEFVEKIFEPFERDTNANQSGTQGSGLGMAITKNIVDMMNGTIKVNTEKDKGTEFIVTVKLKVADKNNSKKHEIFEIDEEKIKGKRILVVEDNEMNREIAEEILKENNFIVETAEDGKYAVEMVKKSEPGYYNVILMDIAMPLMDGYTATREIRNLENQELAQIPIIAMTANAFAEDKEEAKKAGMNEHISKPISIETLLKVISRFL